MAAMPGTVSPTDDALTVCAISLLSAMLANVVHEGLGHGGGSDDRSAIRRAAWSSAFDSKLDSGSVFWIALRSAKPTSVHLRFFRLTSVAFNLLAGTGYFFFRVSPILATGPL
jgi:hypothetical protein